MLETCFKCPPWKGEFNVLRTPLERHFVSVRAPRRRLLATPKQWVAPPDPRGGQALPRCRRNGSPSHKCSMRKRNFFPCLYHFNAMVGIIEILTTGTFFLSGEVGRAR